MIEKLLYDVNCDGFLLDPTLRRLLDCSKWKSDRSALVRGFEWLLSRLKWLELVRIVKPLAEWETEASGMDGCQSSMRSEYAKLVGGKDRGTVCEMV